MSEENMNTVENVAATESSDLPMGSVFGAELGFSEDEDLAKMFAADIAEIEEEATITEDLTGFAAGFPDWDLHPLKKK